NGHIDIIRRSAKIFDKVYVSILENSSKQPLFTVSERADMLRRVTRDIPNVAIDTFSGLLVKYLLTVNAKVIIKGLRAISDFEYEFQMALTNNKLDPDVESLFMMTSAQYQYLSSSIVKEIASYGGCLDDLVPKEIMSDIVSKINGGK